MVDTSSPPPRSSRPRRIALYLLRMYPPAVMIPASAIHFFCVAWPLQALSGCAALSVGARAALGATSVMLFSLLLRVQDELKDATTDLRLGRAGDPRYRDRPIVTGAVSVGDVGLLRWVTLILLLALNLPLALELPPRPTPAALAFVGLNLLIWASLRWFFYPRMAENLLLAFVTHNPLSIAISGYVVAVAQPGLCPGGLTGWTVPLVLGLWAPVAAWETSRKVRLPADETDYVTYSRVLGWKVAALVPACFVVASAVMLGLVGRAAGLGWAYVAVVAAAAAIPVGRCLLLRFAPTPARANLQPAAELYALVSGAALLLALGLRYGVHT